VACNIKVNLIFPSIKVNYVLDRVLMALRDQYTLIYKRNSHEHCMYVSIRAFILRKSCTISSKMNFLLLLDYDQ